MSKNFRNRFLTSLALLALVFLIFNFNIILIYFLILFGVLAILEFLKLTKKILLSKIKFTLVNIIFIFYLFSFCLLFFIFSNFTGLKIILYTLLLGCVASDIGGFVFGKIIKGPKLTKISPNKTYSGAIGSLALSILVMSLSFLNYVKVFDYKIIIVAIMTSIFCQLGDLIFSFFKRKAKLNDTGNFLPGHGGILDRVDGILLGIPIGFITLIILN